MKKIIMVLILALAVMSLSAVSAADNATDNIEAEDTSDDVLMQDVTDGDDVLSENESSAGSDLSQTEITAKATTGYEKFSTQFTVTLTSNGTPLTSKAVKINVNGVDYDRNTDNQGQAHLYVKLTKGTYDAYFSFLGDSIYDSSNGTAKITVKSPVQTTLKVADKNINYRHATKTAFIVRLQKSSGAGVKNQQITVKAGGKTYTAKTDSKGYATVYISLKKGTQKVSYSFKANSPYLSSSGSCKLNVKSAISKGNGYWVWAEHMKKVNFKTLKSKGTKHIFLQSYAINTYGKSAVTSWIANANKYGLKVHIWMQIFFDGKWINPLNGDGSYKYSFLNKKVSLAKTYAKMKGVSGISLDYVRYGGTAYKYDNSVKVINYFVKKVCVEVRKVRPNCIISASVMPEPGMTEYYYGQDIPTLSKYVDVIIPMAYKGNYKKQTSWIKYVSNAIVLESNGAKVWTALQTYKSDSNIKRLSSSQLLKDAQSAMSGGAKGVLLFRIGLTNLLNFNKV